MEWRRNKRRPMHLMNWKEFMNTTSKRKQPTSMIKQLKRRLLVVVGLLVFVLIFCFPVGIVNASIQRNLDEQQIALQQGQSDLLLSMLNQATSLKRYITANDPTFLQSFTQWSATVPPHSAPFAKSGAGQKL